MKFQYFAIALTLIVLMAASAVHSCKLKIVFKQEFFFKYSLFFADNVECSTPPKGDAFTCLSFMKQTRYYYSSGTNTCNKITTCAGDGNNFETLYECEETCMLGKSIQ